MVPIPVDANMYLDNRNKYIQVYVWYPYKAMLLDLYFLLTEPLLKLGMQMEILNFCENTHLLRHRSEDTCASAVYYPVD